MVEEKGRHAVRASLHSDNTGSDSHEESSSSARDLVGSASVGCLSSGGASSDSARDAGGSGSSS